jgi:hypothetical protein
MAVLFYCARMEKYFGFSALGGPASGFGALNAS